MLRPVVLALTVCSGFTGLAYEVTWQKYLAILLGAHGEATAAVLGLFLGGLSLGYWLFGVATRRLVLRGRSSGRPAPLLTVYGIVEAGIGAWCLSFPWLFQAVRSASVWLPIGSGALAFAVDVALAAALIVPPATLMGGTIPILTQALARILADATRVHAQIYAANTAGAFAGTLATGFVLIHWLGLEGTLYAMGAVNVAVGGAFALLGRRRRELVDLDADEAAPVRAGVFAVYGPIALLVGFAMMVLQTVAIRVGGLAFGSSEYTFTMVVAVFVLCIALGSFAVSALPSIGRAVLPAALWVLGLLFTALYFLLETSPYWAHLLRVVFRDASFAFYPYYFLVFIAILAAIGPAVVFSGAVLPLLFHALRREVGSLGSQAGRLY
ncbi:MAG: fused MFS/spermidine synthase, partial [Myxococcota bacterium]